MEVLQLAKKIITKNQSLDIDDPFYILNLDDVRRKYQNWTETLPAVVPYYAVKCNDHEDILTTLRDCGSCFDCASKNEMSKILDLKVDPSRIIYAHPAKQVSHLKFAAEKGIEKVTFDSHGELEKIREFHPNAKVVLRIRFEARDAMMSLGSKFGCDPQTEAQRLIEDCKVLQMDLIGVSFHVGSGNFDYEVYGRAIELIRGLFDYAAGLGIKMDFIDIGGGFLGHDLKILGMYADPLKAAIELNFPDRNVKFAAEPGRYFVDTSMMLVTQVVLKKIVRDPGSVGNDSMALGSRNQATMALESLNQSTMALGSLNSTNSDHFHYYINDSIHLSFLILVTMLNTKFNFSIIKKSKPSTETRMSTIWGCTCNGMDVIAKDIKMPELDTGDSIVFHNMGAYSLTSASKFNGFVKGSVYVVDVDDNKV